jgi:FtsP/CotA-like multicopper oxidase with cupredoxin domain
VVDQWGGNQFAAMTIQKAQTLKNNANLPDRIKQVERIPESEATRTRTFVMETMGMGMMMGGRLTINGKKMDMNRIDARVELGSTEIWEIENRSAMMMNMPHSMHLHDVQFQILDRNGRPPAAYELGRKDTVLIPPGERARIIMRFRDYKGIYMYHCHLLEHEDDGMMGQFEVV